MNGFGRTFSDVVWGKEARVVTPLEEIRERVSIFERMLAIDLLACQTGQDGAVVIEAELIADAAWEEGGGE